MSASWQPCLLMLNLMFNPLWLNTLEVAAWQFHYIKNKSNQGTFPHVCQQRVWLFKGLMSLWYLMICRFDIPSFVGINEKKYFKREIWSTMIWEWNGLLTLAHECVAYQIQSYRSFFQMHNAEPTGQLVPFKAALCSFSLEYLLCLALLKQQ